MKYSKCVDASGEENRKRKLVDIQADWEAKKAAGMTADQYLEELRSKPLSFESEPDTLTTLKIAFEETGILPAGWKFNPYDRSRFSWSEDGLAQMMAIWLSAKAYYNITEKRWYIFKSGYGYEPDDSRKEINALVREFEKAMEYAYSLMQDDRYRQKFLKTYLNCFKKIRTRKQIVDAAGDELGITSDGFDTADNVVAAQNRLIELNDDGSHTAREITPQDKITKHFHADYDENADCPRFKQMLREIFRENEEIIHFFQIFMGYILHGGNPQKVFAIFYGPGTNNGKSTLSEILSELFYDYGYDAPDSVLSRQKRSGAQASPDIAELYGRRLISVHEPPDDMEMDERRVKNYTGNAKITARRLYEGLIKFMPKFTIIMDCNALPIITDLSIFERGTIVVFPFDKSFNENERDGKLIDKLRHELSGILNWLLEGWRMYREMYPNDENWKLPAAIHEKTMSYFLESDPIRVFFNENFVHTKNLEDRVETSQMWAIYEEFVEESGLKKLTKQKFNKRIASILGCSTKDLTMASSGKYYYTGIAFKDEYEPPIDYFAVYLEEEYTFIPYIGIEIGRIRLEELVNGYGIWANENGISDKPSFSTIVSWLESRQKRFQIHWHDGCPWVYGLRKHDSDIDGSAENLEIS